MDLNNTRLWRNSSFINGKWQEGADFFVVANPATKEPIAQVAEVTLQQLEEAVASAKLAQSCWQLEPADTRAQKLMQWYKLIMDNQDDLSLIMTREQGKPLKEARGEIAYGANYIKWYAEECRRANGEVLSATPADKRALVLKRPVGVVAAITPWNFPSAMILRKAAAAIAAGCSFIVKPSELTPLSALALAELAEQAEIPAGIFNVVVGSNSQAIGEVLTMHQDIAKFSFTGSTATGKKLLQQCASTVKKTSMELGGNAPFIAFEDCNIDVAIEGAMNSKFRNSGQTCVCSNRLFVHQSIYAKFVERLAEKVKLLKVGQGVEPDTDIGPLIEEKAVEKVERLITEARVNEARLICGGERVYEDQNFFKPTVIADVKPSMAIFNEEIFGPVAAVIPFDTDQEVLEMANQTEYGLAAYIFTNNLSRIWKMSEQLEFGMVGVNDGLISNPAAPFGGTKHSGMGREGGHWGLDEYLETRYVCMGIE